jgi:hypothetical protein
LQLGLCLFVLFGNGIVPYQDRILKASYLHYLIILKVIRHPFLSLLGVLQLILNQNFPIIRFVFLVIFAALWLNSVLFSFSSIYFPFSMREITFFCAVLGS